MMKIGALVADLDGTLLNADHTVPDRYDELCRFLEARQVVFYVATARPFGNARKLFEGRTSPAGIVACDGAIIASFERGLVVGYAENALPREDAERAVSAIRDSGTQPILFLTREHDFAVVTCREQAEIVPNLESSDPTRPVVIVQSGDVEALLHEVPIRAISVFDERQRVDEAVSAVCAAVAGIKNVRAYSYNETRFGNGRFSWLDVVNATTTKEEAIDQLLRMQGKHGCRFVACGNGDNDRFMLAKAAMAFCPTTAVLAVREICGSTCSTFCEGDAFVGWLIDQLEGLQCW